MTPGHMEYQIPEEVKNILNKVEKAGYKIYIVGGAVRDLLMGRRVSDWDFTTDAKPDEILKLFPEGFYNNKFGTVGIQSSALRLQTSEKKSDDRRLMTDDSIFEITTMRKEGNYRDFRHPTEIAWTDEIEEDLARRDFTINAMALGTEGSVLIDPFNGLKDIKQRTVRAVGDPSKRFAEDALRLMRAIRISAELGFDIEENTFKAIKEKAKLIENVAEERIRDELFKILASVNPYKGVIKLREAGILQIILPEVEKCFGVSQEGPHHIRTYDIGEHSLLVSKETPSSDPIVKLAALLHDVGKPETAKTAPDGNVTFYNHEVLGSRIALQIAKRLNLSKKQTDKLFRLVRWHMYTVDEKQTDSAIRRFIKNVGVENIDDMIALRVGDRLGGGTEKAVSWRMKEFRERIDQVLTKPFSVTDLKVNGKDVMDVLKIPPSRKVGEILDKLFQEVLKDNSLNEREYLLNRIKELVA